MKHLPKVAVVGRPNVGKSTLFNRISGRRLAIMHWSAGVTRDAQRAVCEWNGVPFELVDTGGLFAPPGDRLRERVEAAARRELSSAHAVILVTDGREGLTTADKEVAQAVRRAGKKVYVAVNKTEKKGMEHAEVPFFQLGFQQVFAVSAANGRGVGDLLDQVVGELPQRAVGEGAEAARVAVVGRPNVGKSSLVNALARGEVALVDEAPGTTRDSVDVQLRWTGREVVLVDTAGLKRRARTKGAVESLASVRSLDSIARAEVVVVVLDASGNISRQDVRVAGYAHQKGRGVVVCFNKWDLVGGRAGKDREYRARVKEEMAFIHYAPVLFLSALTGAGIGKLLPMVWKVKEARETWIPTGELNAFFEKIVSSVPPPRYGGGNGKIYYVTQTGVGPPTFTIFVNRRAFFARSYLRFLNNRLRAQYGFVGTVLRLRLKEKRRN